MRVLVVGAGDVGSTFASTAARRPVFTDIVVVRSGEERTPSLA